MAVGLGLVLLWAAGIASPAAAIPVASDPTMIVLPTTLPVDKQLGSGALRLVSATDFTSVLSDFEPVAPPVFQSDLEDALQNPVHFNLEFTFTWNGTVNGGVDADDFYGPGGVPPYVYFTFIDERWRLPAFDENNPLGTSVSVVGGWVIDSFAGDDIVGDAPLVIQDRLTGGGLINDVVGNRWIAVRLPLIDDTPLVFTLEWAIGSDVTDLPGFAPDAFRVRFFREAFVAPEPGALSLLAGALVAVALRRRRRSA